jgi:hypothetical protein
VLKLGDRFHFHVLATLLPLLLCYGRHFSLAASNATMFYLRTCEYRCYWFCDIDEQRTCEAQNNVSCFTNTRGCTITFTISPHYSFTVLHTLITIYDPLLMLSCLNVVDMLVCSMLICLYWYQSWFIHNFFYLNGLYILPLFSNIYRPLVHF